MFGSIGAGELLLIFIIALIVFGPRKLPELGQALGRGLNEFKKASSELRNSLTEEIRVEKEEEEERQRQQLTVVASEPPPEAARPGEAADGHGEEGSTVRPMEPRS